LAAQILGDLGAEVLKVEAPWGDETRRWGPPFRGDVATYFWSCNRNRASLVLDLAQEAGRERLVELAAAADVVIDNFTPARRAKLGLGPELLARHNPALISVSITGYSGKRVEEPGYDLIVQAESGLMGITGPADGEPHKVGVALVDVMTGMMAANAALAALVRQARTGRGAALTVSLWRTAAFSLVNVASAALIAGTRAERWGNAHPSLVPYESFAAADRTIVIGVGSDQQWQKCCEALGIRDVGLRELDNAGRVARRGDIVATLADIVRAWPAAELVERLRAAGVPAAPVLRPDEALGAMRRADPGALVAVGAEGDELVALPIVGDGVQRTHTAPPALGEGGEEMARRWVERGTGYLGRGLSRER
jgi:crotonobetainyl-CoA:carnitine CoA-transferase CaiB-like acyl-CoA transferase